MLGFKVASVRGREDLAPTVVKMRGIVKRFPGVVANADKGRAVVELKVARVSGAEAHKAVAIRRRDGEREVAAGRIVGRAAGVGGADAVAPDAGARRGKTDLPDRIALRIEVILAAVLTANMVLVQKGRLGDGGGPIVVGKESFDGDAHAGQDAGRRGGVVGPVEISGYGVCDVEGEFKLFVQADRGGAGLYICDGETGGSLGGKVGRSQPSQQQAQHCQSREAMA